MTGRRGREKGGHRWTIGTALRKRFSSSGVSPSSSPASYSTDIDSGYPVKVGVALGDVIGVRAGFPSPQALPVVMEYTCLDCLGPIRYEVRADEYEAFKGGAELEVAFPGRTDGFYDILEYQRCWSCMGIWGYQGWTRTVRNGGRW